MGIVLPPFPDAETVVMTLLEPVAPTVTATPATLTPPLIRVQRVGGSDDQITDHPRMEIACYGTDRADAWRLAEECRQLILGSIRTRVAGVLIDAARTDNPPTQVPYATTEDVRRVLAYYRLAWRRPRQA
ncbi:phage tail termination protein [Amycolatopsis sp. NPDC003861]